MAVPAPKKRIIDVFDSFIQGADTSIRPDQLERGWFAWGTNIAIRGGEPKTRPGFCLRSTLPSGNLQGGEYFSLGNGSIVLCIDGVPYNWQIDDNNHATLTTITPTGGPNSKLPRQAYFVQAGPSHMIIQDGESRAMIFDGANCYRTKPFSEGGIPVGTVMAFGNGRLWVANGNEVLAGDLYGVPPNEETNHLYFTETTYLNEGGSFVMPDAVTAMAFIPRIDEVTDSGELLVFTNYTTNVIRTTVFDRTKWKITPGMQRILLPQIGCTGPNAVVQVNRDVFFRSFDGVRSFRSSVSDLSDNATTSLSREAARIYDYDTSRWLRYVSMVNFDNRLLTTGNPGVWSYKSDIDGEVGHVIAGDTIVSLDFAPFSKAGREAPMAYDGEWTGLHVVKFVRGMFNGKDRCFALTIDNNGKNGIYEITKNADWDYTQANQRIRCSIELPVTRFDDPYNPMELIGGTLYLGGLKGDVDWLVEYRPDDIECWQYWQDARKCTTFYTTKEGMEGQVAPPSWTRGYERIRLLPPPKEECNNYRGRRMYYGDQFQVRVSWIGQARLRRFRVDGERVSVDDVGECK